MDLNLTEEQQQIRASAAEFLAGRCRTADARAVRHDPTGHSRELWKEMTELGWTALALPESCGGLDASFLDLCLLAEELGRHQVPSPLLTTVACCALPLARHGSEDQRARWLGAVARGSRLSYVRAAPQGAWQAAGSDIVATPTGDGFTLDGTALFVPYAAGADALLVVARTGGPDELTVLLVDGASPGLRTERLDVVGNDPQYRLELRGVAVPAGRVLGTPGRGHEVIATVSALGATAACAEMTGGAQRVLDMTVEYATQRQQFGRPIGSFQSVQNHCADMAVDVLCSRLSTYEAVWRLGQGLPADLEVSLAKSWVGEAYQRVCARGHQVHGAVGFTDEHDLHLFHRHAIGASLAFGDSDHHTELVARSLGL